MKRKLTLFLSAVMAASSLPMTAYAANFKDINDYLVILRSVWYN